MSGVNTGRYSLGRRKYFACLIIENDNNFCLVVMPAVVCLHKWGEHDHPTMTNPNTTPGNGLILYFRTENMNAIRQNVEKTGGAIEEIFT